MNSKVTPNGPPALPRVLRRPIGIMAVLATLVGAVLATHYSGDIAAGWLDRWAQTAVDSLLPQPGPGALLIDLVGEPLVTAVLAGLLAATCLALGRRRLAVVAVAGPGLTAVATTVLKPMIGRTIHDGYLAYPSGHTAAATVLALVVTLLAVDLLRAGRLPGVLLILAGAGAAGATMAWSQVALGAHYPTDTIGGFCMAMAVVPATALLVDCVVTRSRRRPPDHKDWEQTVTVSHHGFWESMGGRARPGGRHRFGPAAVSRTARATAGRLSWGLADQAVSSLTNFAVGIFVARSLGATGFGVFTLAWVTYGVVLNVSRGLATDPLVVRFSGVPAESWHAAVSRSSGTALLIGLVSGAFSVLAGVALGGRVGAGFVALGLVIPALLLQDSWRFAFFAAGQGRKAFTNDVVWAAALIPALVFAVDDGSVFGFVLAWGLSGAVAAGYGCVQARLLPRVAGMRAWLRQQRDLGPRYLVENVSNSGASQLRMYGLGAIAGLADVGALRGAELLLGPFLAVLMGLSMVAVPEAARVLRRSPSRLPQFCLLLGGGQAVAALAWGLALLFLVSDAIGRLVLDSVWESASALILPVTLSVTGAGFVAGAAAGLRALGAARRSLRAQLFASTAYLTGGLVGAAVTGGALGASWGSTLAMWLGAAVWWAQLRAGLRELATPAPTGPPVAVATQVDHEEMRTS